MLGLKISLPIKLRRNWLAFGSIKHRKHPENICINVGLNDALPYPLEKGSHWNTVVSLNSENWGCVYLNEFGIDGYMDIQEKIG